MSELTLLDYEVFEALRAELTQGYGLDSDSFSESVLGYGFRVGEDESLPIEFVLLCHPAAGQGIQGSVRRAFSVKPFMLNGINITISIHSSSPSNDLLHAITIQDKNPESHKPKLGQKDLSEWVQISLGQTIRQVVLNENRKIILPSYLLRFTPYTSPNLIILRAALSQIHYLHQSGAPIDEFEQRTVSARMTEISRWSSFSRTSIYRLLHEDPHSRWLVNVENKGSYQNDQGQHISQPNQYLLEPLKLTPGDAADLLSYIKSHQDEWQTVDDCLIGLARIEPRKVLAYPYRLPQSNDLPEPVSVLTIIQRHFGPVKLTAERLSLLDKVRDNLIGRDFITVPWYVLRNLLPVYGASIITLYMMCQPLLFRQGGVQRDTFWLPDGSETLEAWTNDRSLVKYFPKTNAKGRGRPAGEKGSSDSAWRKGKREMLSDFFLREETRKDRQGRKHWKIRVHQYPVLDRDKQLMTNLYQIVEELIQQDKLLTLTTLFDREAFVNPKVQNSEMVDRLYQMPLTSSETNTFSLIANRLFSDFETPDNLLISDFDTPASRIISIFEPPVQLIISNNATPAPVLISVFETYLKILYILKDSFKTIVDSSLPPDSSQPADMDKSLGVDGWDFNQILGAVNSDIRNKIIQTPEHQTKFIAFLIHASLNARVQQPLNLAISKSFKEELTPTPAAIRLAKQLPNTLLSVLVSIQTDPNRVMYQQDTTTRAIAADIHQLLIGEELQNQPILIQRLIDLLVN